MSLLLRVARRGGVSSSIRSLSTTAEETYTDRMKKKGRPVSPHVTTYAFPIVALSSITQRVTGVMLTVGMAGMAGVSLVGGDVGGMAAAIGESSLAPVAKLCVSFPVAFHFCGAVRHAVWDKMPQTLENKEAEQSSWAVFGTAAVVSVVFSSISFPKKKEE